MKTAQITAPVSAETKRKLDEFVRATGQKKGYVVEAALQHHMRLLDEIPAEMVIPPTMVVTRKSGDQILSSLAGQPSPTAKLRALARGKHRR